MMKRLRCAITPVLIALLVLGSLPVAAAPQSAPGSDLVSTRDALNAEQGTSARERIHDVLARDDVQEELLAQGVEPAEVEARVAALSDQEAAEMADQLEQLPAGASVVGALFAVFVILLVTDILGLTDVYPFTR